jgi:hypothetical protein
MKGKTTLSSRTCNLCSHQFEPRTVFDRFCCSCKHGDELLRFAEWLPELNAEAEELLTA